MKKTVRYLLVFLLVSGLISGCAENGGKADDRSTLHEDYPRIIFELRKKEVWDEQDVSLYAQVQELLNGDYIVAGDYCVGAVTQSGSARYVFDMRYLPGEGSWPHTAELGAESRLTFLADSAYIPIAVTENGEVIVSEDILTSYIEWETAGQEDAANVGAGPDISEQAQTIRNLQHVKKLYGLFPYYALYLSDDKTAGEIGIYQLAWGEEELRILQSWRDLEDVRFLYWGYSIAALQSDGKVQTINFPDLEWDHVVSMDAGENSLFALTEEGTVLSSDPDIPTEGMQGIISIAAGYDPAECKDIIIGLRQDGTVVDQFGNPINEFEDIVAIDVSDRGAVIGLKRDGKLCWRGIDDEKMTAELTGWDDLYVPEFIYNSNFSHQ